MLVLTLRAGECVYVGGAKVSLDRIDTYRFENGDTTRSVRIGIEAPKEVRIMRGELHEKLKTAIEESQKSLATWSKL